MAVAEWLLAQDPLALHGAPVTPLLSQADEHKPLWLLLNAPQDGAGAVCAVAGIVPVVAGAPLALNDYVVVRYIAGDPSYNGAVVPRPPSTGQVYSVQGSVVVGAGAMGDTAQLRLSPHSL